MDHRKLLKRLGLSEYESRAYLALATLGPSSVKDIVSQSNIPRNKTYEALQKLEQRNLISTLPVTPRKFKITNPELLEEEVKELNSSIQSLKKLIETPIANEFKDLFWVIKGQDAIINKLAAENKKAKKEILACSRLSKRFYKNIRIIKECVDKGINFKIICNFKSENIKSYKAYLDTGAKIRVFNEKAFGPLLPRITIFDGSIARLTIGRPEVKDNKEYITLWTESKVFATMLKSHFNNMWKRCEPIEKYINDIKF